MGLSGFLQCVPENGECVQGVRARWDLRTYQELAGLKVSCTQLCCPVCREHWDATGRDVQHLYLHQVALEREPRVHSGTPRCLGNADYRRSRTPKENPQCPSLAEQMNSEKTVLLKM